MKKVAHQIISFLLLIIIVISNAGFAIFNHSCNMNDVAPCGMSTEMSCCVSDITFQNTIFTESLDASCCDIKVAFIKFDFEGKFDNFQPLIKKAEMQIEYGINKADQSLIDHRFAFNITKPPLTKSGRSVLQASQILNI